MKFGVLALQGDFAEHCVVLRRLGHTAVEVRLPGELNGLDGLIIPGGESTTIGKLAVQYGLMDPIRELARSQPVWGTCAGAIFLSQDARRVQPLLNLMDIRVERNAFGRQVDSFETDLDIPALAAVETTVLPAQATHANQRAAHGNGRAAQRGGRQAENGTRPFHAVFIRAPLIEWVGPGVEVLSRLPDGRIVAARQGHLLATSFHPELTDDDRFHRLFTSLAQARS
jgi:5'-phosphate synthase pdxT subunit